MCNNFYIGSTNQYLHDRANQHLLNKEGSLYQHLQYDHQIVEFHNKIKYIKVSVLYQCLSIKDLLPIEAIYIKPHMGIPYLLNRKEEMKDVMSLLS